MIAHRTNLRIFPRSIVYLTDSSGRIGRTKCSDLRRLDGPILLEPSLDPTSRHKAWPGVPDATSRKHIRRTSGKLRSDSLRIADGIERSAPLLQLVNPRPAARHPEGRPAKPISEYPRQAAPQGLDPYGRSSPAHNSIEETVLDIPAFLRRKAN